MNKSLIPFLLGRRENLRITPSARVEWRAVSDFYSLKTSPVPSVIQETAINYKEALQKKIDETVKSTSSTSTANVSCRKELETSIQQQIAVFDRGGRRHVNLSQVYAVYTTNKCRVWKTVFFQLIHSQPSKMCFARDKTRGSTKEETRGLYLPEIVYKRIGGYVQDAELRSTSLSHTWDLQTI